MRIITGKYGGRPLKSIPTNHTRPTTDMVKEAMFHMAGPYFNGGTALDLYSGSGALGIEAVSRGIDKAYLVDKNRAAAKVIEENIEMTKEPDKFEVIEKDSTMALDLLASQELKFKVVILDPPYKEERIIEDIYKIIDLDLFADTAMIICETDSDVDLPEQIDRFNMLKQKNHGQTNIYIYLSRR